MTTFEAMETGGEQLRRALRVRHLVMLSVGGTIASGFLLFAASAIGIAGPAMIISYVIAGIITVAVMACLAEMCVQKPVSASFATYARDTMGPLAGFLTGWNYWLAWVMGAATESVAAGTYFHSFYSFAPIWIVAAIIIAIEMVINLVGVLFMGEYEFILSTIKILALAAFIVIGIMAILGIGFDHHGVTQLTANGGFFPKGGGAVLDRAADRVLRLRGHRAGGRHRGGEREPAVRDVPRALFWTVLIVVVLFVVGIFVLLAISPWASASTSSSPFVDALKSLNLPVIATIFNWVVIRRLDIVGRRRPVHGVPDAVHPGPGGQLPAAARPDQPAPQGADAGDRDHGLVHVHRRRAGLLLPVQRVRVRGQPVHVRLPVRLADDRDEPAAVPDGRWAASGSGT